MPTFMINGQGRHVPANAPAHRYGRAAARIGAAAGLRAMLAPALVSRALAKGGVSGGGLSRRLLGAPAAAAILPAFAALELLADKLPMIPPRIAPGALIARAVSGAWAAAAAAGGQRRRLTPALVGAASAITAAFAGYHLRRWVVRRTGLPDALVAVAEDAVAVALGQARPA
jgi:uncharacterized membrane protein